jgi:hypothetical protein
MMKETIPWNSLPTKGQSNTCYSSFVDEYRNEETHHNQRANKEEQKEEHQSVVSPVIDRCPFRSQ